MQLMPTQARKAIVSLSLAPKLIDKLSDAAREQRKMRSEFVADLLTEVLK
jgi:metal-responsive CopG/Arc/MetJ family transcriptional regulator